MIHCLPFGLLPNDFVSVILPVGGGFAIYPDEANAVLGAVESRRNEFATGRACIRQALALLGHPECQIPIGAGREPVWPPGITGSVSHSRTWAVAALTRTGVTRRYVGIDVEPAVAVDAEIWPLIAAPGEPPLPGERALFEGLRFSCKEAAFKCWFQAGGKRWLDFTDVRLLFSAETFTATMPVPGPRNIQGRWTLTHGHWWSAAWI